MLVRIYTMSENTPNSVPVSSGTSVGNPDSDTDSSWTLSDAAVFMDYRIIIEANCY